MTDLTELLTRLEKATGPDRELGDDICAYFSFKAERYQKPPHVTGSIDAAAALMARVMPGARAGIAVGQPDYATCELYMGTESGFDQLFKTDRLDAHVALAMCAAIVKAKISENQK